MKKQVILITGASSGMGKHAACELIKAGHIVYGAARRINKMQDLLESGGHAIEMDITKPEEVQLAVAKVISEQGSIDVLINNAGYAVYGAVEDVPIKEARRQFDVNIFGLAHITQEVLPYMREAKKGKIINISSMGGRMYTPLGAWYHATKHALEGWSDCLRVELEQFGIDVVVIQPGIIKTEFDDVMLEPMMQRSGSGPYADLARAVKKGSEKTYSDKNSSPPEVITKCIIDAVNADQPKTRYAAGKMAKLTIYARKFLPDRVFDKFLKSQM
ncbi:oxidoreductase [bacterium]|nr:oxidoreductase [bacterium]